MRDYIIYILLALILAISIYGLFRKPEQIKPETLLEIQRQAIRDELAKIPRDSLIIERYYTIRTVTHHNVSEFERADSLKKDSLFWFYYLNWKKE